jgi:hypothetical protein
MNFQRIVSVFLASLVLFVSTNFAMNIHSCKGVIAAVQTVFDTSEPCQHHALQPSASCCFHEIEANNCCSDTTIIADIDDTVVDSHQIILNFPITEIELFSVINYLSFNTEKILTYFCDANAPPFYKLYQKFIFYAQFFKVKTDYFFHL